MANIRSALTPEQWKQRQAGAVAIEVIDNEVNVVVRDPDNDVVSVSGADELGALLALANYALADSDRRKFTPADLAILKVLTEQIDTKAIGGLSLLSLAEALRDKLAALGPLVGRAPAKAGMS